jgi:hypothetical protein
MKLIIKTNLSLIQLNFNLSTWTNLISLSQLHHDPRILLIMASQRTKSSFSFKTAFIVISGVLTLIIFFIYMNKSTETVVEMQSDDQSESEDQDLVPSQPQQNPAQPKDTPKADPLPNNGDGGGGGGGVSSDPVKDANYEAYVKSEQLWLKIKKLIEDKDLESIRAMLKLDPELVTGPIFDGKYLIHIACQEGYPDLVTELINLGSDIKILTKDSIEAQPIHFAANLSTTEVLDKLVGKGAEIDAKDINGDTPLMYAVICEEPEPVKYLLKNGANPNLQVSPKITVAEDGTDEEADVDSPIHIKTILNTAISLDHREIVDLLLANNADPTLVDSMGWNALHAAAFYGREEIIDKLLATGKLDVHAEVTGSTKLAGKKAVDMAKDHESVRKKLLGEM